jgi:hypothetical protein
VLGAEAEYALDSPFAFFALTVKVYGVPFVNPEIETGLVVCAGEKAVKDEPPFNEYL